MDKYTLKRIEGLHPCLREELKVLFRRINEEILLGRAKCRMTQGYRSVAEQDALYAKGRSVVGKRVTNAPGGSSFHNFGLAFDIALIIDGKLAVWDIGSDFDGDGESDWMECVKVFKEAGYFWGGDFRSFVDYPHFEKSKGLSLRECRELYKVRKGEYISHKNLV